MSIKSDLKSGVFYTALAKFAGIFVSLGVTAVLARLFTPEQFGTISIATVFISFFEILGNVGMGPAVVQNKDLDSDDLNGIFSLSLWIAIGMAFVLAAIAIPVSNFYNGGAELRNVLMILTVSLFFYTMNMVPNALLMKAKRFKFAAIRALVVQVVTGIIAIVAALLGMGIYALTINPVLTSILVFVINYRQQPLKIRFAPGKKSIQKVLNFSVFQFAFQLVNYFSRNLDRMLMGKYLNVSDIGYYDKANRLTSMPLTSITFVLSSVMHPVFAQIQEDKSKIAEEYLKVVKLLAYIGFPLATGMVFMSGDLILFFFGDQWTASIRCMQIASISVGFQMLSSSSGSIFQALNDTKRLFGCGLFTAFTMITAVCVGVFYFKSIEGLAASMLVAFILNFIQGFFSLFVRSIKDGWLAFWKTLIGPTALSCILAAVLWLLSTPISHISNHFICLVLYTIAGTAVSLLFIQLVGAYDIIGKVKSLSEKKQ